MTKLYVGAGPICLLAFLPSLGRAETCATARTSEAIAACLIDDLKASDVGINETYQKLMTTLPNSGKVVLRARQRAWVKERDAACAVDEKERDRERWYQALAGDYGKVICVTRYSRERTEELDRQLRALTAPAGPSDVPQPAKSIVSTSDPYQRFWSGTHEKGRWYFELTLDTRAVVKTGPTALWWGCRAGGKTHGTLWQVHGVGTTQPVSHGAVALDLDDGMLYTRIDGVWAGGPPGSNTGLGLKLGQPYQCGVSSTLAIGPLIDAGLLKINFGDGHFDYSIPDGYLPLTNGGP